jgi:hypothetical protein
VTTEARLDREIRDLTAAIDVLETALAVRRDELQDLYVARWYARRARRAPLTTSQTHATLPAHQRIA